VIEILKSNIYGYIASKSVTRTRIERGHVTIMIVKYLKVHYIMYRSHIEWWLNMGSI